MNKVSFGELPPLQLEWGADGEWLEIRVDFMPRPQLRSPLARLLVDVETVSRSDADSPRGGLRLWIKKDDLTLQQCDDTCFCALTARSADGAYAAVEHNEVTYSHSCRAAVRPGSHCSVPQQATRGVNWVTGTADEYMQFKPTRATQRCAISASHAGLVLVVYQSCSRFGPQLPLAFANSEKRGTVRVVFPCNATAPPLIFWSAEYVPGRFHFTVKELV